VPLFGEDQFDPRKRIEAVSFEEQLRALDEVVKEGKVSLFVCDGLLCESWAWAVDLTKGCPN
jgi:hypothetical protein